MVDRGIHRSVAGGGVTASIGASVLFAVLFLIPPLIDYWSGNSIFGWRVIVMFPLLFLMLCATGRWNSIASVVTMIRRRPSLLVVLCADSVLLGVQLWLFGWAPQSGRALDASSGFLLLPVVLMMVGVVGHKEQLSRIRALAVGAAATGVGVSLFYNGGLSWLTAVVALGYPLYFVLRTRWGLNGTGALVLELALAMPVAVAFLVADSAFTAVVDRPSLIVGPVMLGVVGACALALYLAASTRLSFVLFGLLGYLEPVLLLLISTLVLGEHILSSDWFVYGPIVAALGLLGIERMRIEAGVRSSGRRK